MYGFSPHVYLLLGCSGGGFADDDLPLIRFDFIFSVSGKRQDCTLVLALTAQMYSELN